MSGIRCHRCGCSFAEGALKYQVAVRIRSLFDGVIPEGDVECGESELARLLSELANQTEEDLNRQVYEDDVFIMCPACKEAFMEEIYAHLNTRTAPEFGRAHLIH